MMINAANITAYIRFLYQQKYQSAAPEEIVASWSQVPEEELGPQLQALYQHWGLDEAAATQYERAFVDRNKTPESVGDFLAPPPAAAPVHRQTVPAYQHPVPSGYESVTPPKSNGWKTIAIVAILILLAAGGILAYQLYQNQQGENTANLPITTDTTRPVIAAVPEPEPEPMVTELPMDDSDEINIDNLRQLLAAEDAQDIEQILNYYAPYMQRYWDISYPTQEQLEKRYTDSWQKVADAQNTVLATRKIAPFTYDADVQFRFYDIKKEKEKTVSNTLRFVFDDTHHITQVYQLK